MIHVGIDPGKAGGMAALAPGGPVVLPMPLVRSAKGRDEYDLPEIRARLRTWEGMGFTSDCGIMTLFLLEEDIHCSDIV